MGQPAEHITPKLTAPVIACNNHDKLHRLELSVKYVRSITRSKNLDEICQVIATFANQLGLQGVFKTSFEGQERQCRFGHAQLTIGCENLPCYSACGKRLTSHAGYLSYVSKHILLLILQGSERAEEENDNTNVEAMINLIEALDHWFALREDNKGHL